MRDDWGRVLVVCAHPDDEVLGAAFPILRSQEIRVVWLAAADYPNRTHEERADRVRQRLAAMRELGVSASDQYPLALSAACRMDTLAVQVLASAIEDYCGTFMPDTVITHWHGDVNQDHQAVARAVEVAVRPGKFSSIRRVVGMEVLSSTEAAFLSPAFRPTVFVSADDAMVRTALQAFNAYTSEVNRERGGPRSAVALEALWRVRGAQCGHPFAQGFEAYRDIY